MRVAALTFNCAGDHVKGAHALTVAADMSRNPKACGLVLVALQELPHALSVAHIQTLLPRFHVATLSCGTEIGAFVTQLVVLSTEAHGDPRIDVVGSTCLQHNVWGTKASAMVMLAVDSRFVTVVASHLPATSNRDRTDALQQIQNVLKSGRKAPHMVCLLGDLNFRVDTRAPERDACKQTLVRLFGQDTVAPCPEVPTYKVCRVGNRGKVLYAGIRQPSFTDRICLLGTAAAAAGLELTTLGRPHSDHLPVLGQFLLG